MAGALNYKGPAVSNQVSTAVAAFSKVVKVNFQDINKSMIRSAAYAAGVMNPKVSFDNLAKLITNTIVGITHRWEGGWADHQNDSGGATMRGVILTTFRGTFNDIFKNTNIPAVKAAANNIESQLKGWRTNNDIGKQFLYQLLSDQQIASLWITRFFCAPENGYPIVISAEDPYLGYMFFELCWGSGPGIFSNSKINELAAAPPFYKKKGIENWARFVNRLGDLSPEFCVKLLQNRLQYILAISRPGTKNNQWRKGWLNRFINAPGSNIDALVIINEDFNLNKKNIYSFTAAEQAHLRRKAAIYKTIKLEFPNL